MADREWSTYQLAGFDWAADMARLAASMRAVAGSGKTTESEEICRRMPRSLNVGYVVFNSKNSKEAQTRMPDNVTASTFHSACMRPISKAIGGYVKVEGNKLHWLIVDAAKESDDNPHPVMTGAERGKFEGAIQKLVGSAKNAGFGTKLHPIITDADWEGLIDHYSIELLYGGNDEDYDRLVELSQIFFDKSYEDAMRGHRIDFDDMLWLAIKLDVNMPRYDVLIVDEAQDTNAIQRAVLHKMLKVGGRILIVGDPRQAIYGFRGADADAMELLEAEFNCEKLPLSINYRCSKAVIREAQPFCPELEAWDKAPEGSVETLGSWKLEDFLPTDAILCRTTAPIVSLAMRMVSKEIPCTVLGREIGKDLIDLVNRLRRNDGVEDMEDLADALDNYRKAQIAKALRRDNEMRVAQVEDQCDSLEAIMANQPESCTLDKLVDVIDKLFQDFAKRGGITLATVHKSKGLEWQRVFILNRGEMPSKRAVKEWQKVQESNLIYVAITRAKIDLKYVDLGGIK